MIKEANDKNRPITYPRMGEKFTIKGKRGVSLYDALGLAQSLVERGLLECDSKTVISPQGNLTLTRKGKRAYRKEYMRKNPEDLPWRKKVIMFIMKIKTPICFVLGAILSAMIVTLVSRSSPEWLEWLKSILHI